MTRLKRRTVDFLQQEDGQDIVEYALIAGFIGFASVAALTWFSSSIAAEVNAVGSELINAV